VKPVSGEGLTELLRRWSAGDREAAEQAMALAYDELKSLARAFFRRERAGHTLQATALVHEAFARLVDQEGIDWQGRAHFVGFFAHVMRRVLVDHARERNAAKRGGGRFAVTLVESDLPAHERGPDLLALDAALDRLQALDPQKAALVELRFFGGCSIEETARGMGVSPATANRQWRRARAWLYRELAPAGAADQPPEP
jgi:RNA polymerase sigma factor (TIGR02999 family)